MIRYIYLLSIGFAAASIAVAAETDAVSSPSLSDEQIMAMEQRIATISDPAARLFFQANVHRAKGELEEALKLLAKLNAHYAHDKRWIARSELLTAKLYLELGMPDQAEVTARQVEFLNKDTEVAETARAFREHIMEQSETSEQGGEK